MKFLSKKDLKRELLLLSRSLKPLAKEAYLFGSALTAAVPMESDVDVLVVPKSKVSYAELYDRVGKAFDALLEKGLVLHLVVASGRHSSDFIRSAKAYRIL